MHLFLGFFLLMFTAPTWAMTSVTTKIHDLHSGSQIDEETLVYLANGKVARISSNNRELLDALHEAKTAGSWLKIKLNSSNEVVSLSETKALLEAGENFAHIKGMAAFTPSVIESPAHALELFRNSRQRKDIDSECYNRAHVWTYEWRAKHNLFTNKIWVFFTEKYIRKHKFDWWFHVAPYFHVMENGQVWERVADVKYNRAPNRIKQWTDIFLRDRAECPVVEKYSDHANYPETGSCFIMKSSMYYYQPIDLELLENDGTEKNVWHPSEVIHAYKEAFEIDV